MTTLYGKSQIRSEVKKVLDDIYERLESGRIWPPGRPHFISLITAWPAAGCVSLSNRACRRKLGYG